MNIEGPEGVKWELGFAIFPLEKWVSRTGNHKQRDGNGINI